MRKKVFIKRFIVGVLAAVLVLTMLPVAVPQTGQVYAAQSYIGEKKAREIALKDAGAKEKDVANLKCRLDKKDKEYEVSFTKNGYNYGYSIRAGSGKIEEKEYEIVKIDKKSGKTTISKSKAKNIACKAAGVKSGKNLKIRKQNWRGTKVWKVEFKKGKYEYEYKINIYSGRILEMEYELDD